MDFEEALRVLGLGGDRSVERGAVRKAYLRRALEVHPDRSASKRKKEKRTTASRDGSDGSVGTLNSVDPSGPSPSPSPSSTTAFQRLRSAYELVMEAVSSAEGDSISAGISDGGRFDLDAMDEILTRALRGEDVRGALERRGGWRPGEGFGVDYGVRWGADGDAGGSDGVGWREALERGLAVESSDREEGEEG